MWRGCATWWIPAERRHSFDLERDPLAYEDVAGESEYADQLQAVRKRLLERLLERERPLPRQWTY